MEVQVIALGLIMLMSGASYLSAAEMAAEETTKMEAAKVDKSCPVCGPEEAMAGDENITYELEGKTYYFCSTDCMEEFKKNPGKYINAGHANHDGHDHK